MRARVVSRSCPCAPCPASRRCRPVVECSVCDPGTILASSCLRRPQRAYTCVGNDVGCLAVRRGHLAQLCVRAPWSQCLRAFWVAKRRATPRRPRPTLRIGGTPEDIMRNSSGVCLRRSVPERRGACGRLAFELVVGFAAVHAAAQLPAVRATWPYQWVNAAIFVLLCSSEL